MKNLSIVDQVLCPGGDLISLGAIVSAEVLPRSNHRVIDCLIRGNIWTLHSLEDVIASTWCIKPARHYIILCAMVHYIV